MPGRRPNSAALRLEAIQDLSVLEQTDEATALAQSLLLEVPLPERAAVDSLHIAIAAVNGVEYLLTWNCTHIANVALRANIEAVCRTHGFEPPAICTPEELLEDDPNHG
jgi:hypothetical protein